MTRPTVGIVLERIVISVSQVKAGSVIGNIDDPGLYQGGDDWESSGSFEKSPLFSLQNL